MAKKVGVLFIGVLGSVATTVIAGMAAMQRGLVPVRGLITEAEPAKMLPLVRLGQICFGGWDIRKNNLYRACIDNGIINKDILALIKKNLDTVPVYNGLTNNIADTLRMEYELEEMIGKLEIYQQLEGIINQIEAFKQENKLDFVVVVNTSSTEALPHPQVFKWNLARFELAIAENDTRLLPTMIYAYAAIRTGCGFINFTPNICIELPALKELAAKMDVPLVGKDGKTGQTLYKTVLAAMFKLRELKVKGWYSTNILGNKDGSVLRHAEHSETKIKTKTASLKQILGYDDFEHLVRIDYYQPRGDDKEAWDNIDFEGWMGKPMSMKINWLGNDSALAAPLIIDLVRMMEHAYRRGEKGVLTYLDMFFKSPYEAGETIDETGYDFFSQWLKFKDYIERCRKSKNK